MATPDRPVNPTAFATGLLLGSVVFLALVITLNFLIPAWILMLLLGAAASLGIGWAFSFWTCVLIVVILRALLALIPPPKPSSVP